jgi:hypothetical protein
MFSWDDCVSCSHVWGGQSTYDNVQQVAANNNVLLNKCVRFVAWISSCLTTAQLR